ncbi:MAG: transcriptional regulator GutM [Ardenticatenaceae bacterium]|nr:transcriptional regulator GutM [Ardenticatenaceae bacterium]
MLDSPWSLVIVLLVVSWLIQFGFSYYQMRNYSQRLSILRKDGLMSVGKGGGQYKGRAYGVLVVDKNQKVIHAEKLAGATVFAKLRPVPHLVGRTAAEIAAEDTDLGLSKKLTEAFRFAANEILQADKKPEEEEEFPGELSIA